MPPVVFTLAAIDCPSPAYTKDPINPRGGGVVPRVLDPLYGTSMTDNFNRNARWVEALGRSGAGTCGIAFGLEISSPDGSVQLVVQPGQVVLDVPITKSGISTLSIADDRDNYIWMDQDGALGYRLDGDLDELLPPNPAIPSAYLGRISKAAGVTTQIDMSGVAFIKGGVLWRCTADAGCPTDVPPDEITFWTRTNGGVYFWDGHSYGGVLLPEFGLPETALQDPLGGILMLMGA